ncbi:MAG: hypothetical protein QG577_2671 [Thermodesulfobacteriota bacterium]|nr:hypothetical protein [Thermodesulfobacteriota bacterium]
MRKRSHLASVGFSLLIVLCMPGLGHAWEFGLKGTFYWSYEWYDQMGNRGFFGPYNVDEGTRTGDPPRSTTAVANLNFWNGGQFDTNFVTGSSSGWSYFNVEFEPEIKINQAIRIRGLYRLGTWGDPVASDYHTQDAPGARNAFTEGQWTQFWLTANTPWGIFGVGKRPWKFGMGLQYDGSNSLTTESIALVAPYGPFDFGLAFYPYRFVGHSSIILAQVFRNRVGAASAFSDPYDLPHYYSDIATTPGQYYSHADRSGSFSRDFQAFLSYSSGPLQVGILGAVGAYHIGHEAILIDLTREPDPVIPLDSQFSHGTIFLKYNNGRLFLNSEAAWVYWIDRFQPQHDPPIQYQSQDNKRVYMPYTRYIEQWRAILETGLYAGPGKVSFMTAWSPGPDRRAGRYIDRQSAAFVWHPTYDTHLGNYSAFSPYTHLFGYNYGSGLNAYDLSGDGGYLRDAFVLATRLDYAVASNLNVFGSFFWAQRTSHGYPWGALRPRSGETVDGNIDFSQVTPGPLNIPGPSSRDDEGKLIGDRSAVPNIPTRELGYEIYVGLDWQLLEGWNFGILFAYWAPGKWFNYACIDRSVSGWQNLAITGARPDRAIDPIIGGEFTMTFQF